MVLPILILIVMELSGLHYFWQLSRLMVMVMELPRSMNSLTCSKQIMLFRSELFGMRMWLLLRTGLREEQPCFLLKLYQGVFLISSFLTLLRSMGQLPLDLLLWFLSVVSLQQWSPDLHITSKPIRRRYLVFCLVTDRRHQTKSKIPSINKSSEGYTKRLAVFWRLTIPKYGVSFNLLVIWSVVTHILFQQEQK